MGAVAVGEGNHRLVGPVAFRRHGQFSQANVPTPDFPVGTPAGQHRVVSAKGEAPDPAGRILRHQFPRPGRELLLLLLVELVLVLWKLEGSPRNLARRWSCLPPGRCQNVPGFATEQQASIVGSAIQKGSNVIQDDFQRHVRPARILGMGRTERATAPLVFASVFCFAFRVIAILRGEQ